MSVNKIDGIILNNCFTVLKFMSFLRDIEVKVERKYVTIEPRIYLQANKTMILSGKTLIF